MTHISFYFVLAVDHSLSKFRTVSLNCCILFPAAAAAEEPSNEDMPPLEGDDGEDSSKMEEVD